MTYQCVAAALALLLASPTHAQDIEVMKGHWCWACCGGAYSGGMTLDRFEGNKFWGSMGAGAQGGTIAGTVDEDGTVELKRTSVEGCTLDEEKFQTWTGTLSHDDKLGWTINGSITGCNTTKDKKIVENSQFLMNRKTDCP